MTAETFLAAAAGGLLVFYIASAPRRKRTRKLQRDACHVCRAIDQSDTLSDLLGDRRCNHR